MNRTIIIPSYLKRINQHVEPTQYTKFCDNVITSLIYFVHLVLLLFSLFIIFTLILSHFPLTHNGIKNEEYG